VYTAIALARRGHDVSLIDRDPGPPHSGEWKRAGVMQFQHAHGWRPQVLTALRAEMPDVVDALFAAGARRMSPPGLAEIEAMACRRSVVERTLRWCAAREPGLDWRTGHVDDITIVDGVATGLLVDGDHVPADLVVVATGRASHLGDALRGPVEGGPCGFSYVSRMYRARAGHPGYDRLFPSSETGPGYVSLVMGQDAGTHSVVIAYPSHVDEFAALRTNTGQETAARLIPNLAPWTDPARFEPISDALVGGHLTNTYRFQGPTLGLPPARGLFFLGDAVLTTNPAWGRNLALLLPHAQQLLTSLDDPRHDLDDAALALDTWAEQHLRPWFLDHVHFDRTLLARFAGEDIDLGDRIPSDVIVAAAEVDESIKPLAGMYAGMVAGPDVLDAAQAPVRALLAEGWRPEAPGPTGPELAAALPEKTCLPPAGSHQAGAAFTAATD
jgi:2-polyprenyl-6-methoxyphenol hydroxylase-like FAD-dependent oxidoreductase